MFRVLAYAAVAGAIGFGLAPAVSAAPQLSDSAASPSFVPATPVSQQNAIETAQDYLNFTAFSRQGLIRQLITIDGYTPSQAAYGVAATGL